MKKLSETVMKSGKLDLHVELKLIYLVGNGVRFLVDFINDSGKDVELPFSENVDEAARLSLCLYFQGKILEPAEYRQAIRSGVEQPVIHIKSGERYSFGMEATLQNKLLKFGRTSYIIRPGLYRVRFVYDGIESNEVDWEVV